MLPSPLSSCTQHHSTSNGIGHRTPIDGTDEYLAGLLTNGITLTLLGLGWNHGRKLAHWHSYQVHQKAWNARIRPDSLIPTPAGQCTLHLRRCHYSQGLGHCYQSAIIRTRTKNADIGYAIDTVGTAIPARQVAGGHACRTGMPDRFVAHNICETQGQSHLTTTLPWGWRHP